MSASARGEGGDDFAALDPMSASSVLRLLSERMESDLPDRPLLEALAQSVGNGRLKLPVIPSTVSRTLELMKQEDVDLGELSVTVELDPSLATRIVGLANSALFAGTGTILSVRDALMRLGLREAQNVVVSVALRSAAFRVPGYEARASEVWEHSLYTALACQAILAESPPWDDAGFLLGLVHDIGRLVGLGMLAEVGRSRMRLASLAASSAEPILDLIHAELGALAVSSWSFPAVFSQAVRHHHEPDGCEGEGATLTRGLYAADTLAQLHHRGWSPGSSEATDERVVDLLEPFGIDLDRCAQLLNEIEGGFEALAKLA